MKHKLLSAALASMLALPLVASASSADLPDTRREGAPVLRIQSAVIDPTVVRPMSADEPLAAGTKGLFVVQFQDVITDASHQAMESVGAEVGSYIPEFAFLVRMTPEQAAEIEQHELVRAVVRYRPEWKISPELAGGSGEAKVRIRTFGESTVAASAIQGVSVTPSERYESGLVATVTPRAVSALALDENVVYIEAEPEYTLYNDVARGVMKVGGALGNPWPNTLTGTNQVIAVADSGVDTGSLSTLHPDLRTRVIKGLPIGRPGSWSDLDGHGTHVAGSVVGDGTASNGQIKGVAPGAKIVVQAMGTATGGLAFPTYGQSSGVYGLLLQAGDNGARIHTNSWGHDMLTEFYDYDLGAAQADYYNWNFRDRTVLFAAGNDGPGAQSIASPGTAKNVITVGASENPRWPAESDGGDLFAGNNENQIASFSSRGYTLDGRVKPDVVAPGTWILSTRAASALGGNYENNKYAYSSGTSMATPLTAGGAALVRQYYQTVKGVTAPTGSLVKATLINGAEDMGYGWGSPAQGWGRVNLTNSLYPARGRKVWFENESVALGTGELKRYEFVANSGEILKFTLAWTDYPAMPPAGVALVNDLDLTVFGPDGKVYRGNCFVANNASDSCGWDGRNNVENVYFQAPQAGAYTVVVSGYNVPTGKQSYSLVASGRTLTQGADTQAPQVIITAPANNALVASQVAVTANATDNVGVAGVEFYLDGILQAEDREAPYGWSWNAAAGAGGSHTLTAKAYDLVGRTAQSTPVVVRVDKAGPTVSLTAPSDQAAVKGTVAVKASGTDDVAVAKVEFYIDANQQPSFSDLTAPYEWSWDTKTATAGTHSLQAKIYDTAGNASVSQPISVSVDNAPPTGGLVGLTANGAYRGVVEVGANVTDNLGITKVEFYRATTMVATDSTAPYAWTWDTAALPTATHAISAKAYDASGNIATFGPISVLTDNQAPAVTAITRNGAEHFAGTVTLNVSATDDKGVAKVEFYLDEAAAPAFTDSASPYSWAWNTAGVVEGPHTITIKALDAAGNLAQKAVTATVDNAAPSIAITSPANNSSFPAGTVPFEVASADNLGVSKVEYTATRTGGTPYRFTTTTTPFSWDWNTAGVPNATYTVVAKAYDAANNNATSSAITVTLDTTKPTVSIASPANAASVKGLVTVKATAQDTPAVTKVQFYLDGELKYEDTSSPYEWAWDTAAVPNGEHILTAKAYDAAGNETTSSEVIAWVDTVAPVPTLVLPLIDSTVKGDFPVVVTATDNRAVSRVDFYLSGVKKGSATPSAQQGDTPFGFLMSAPTGAYEVMAKAYDAAGNEASTATVSVKVDKDPPTVSLTGLTANAVYKGTVTVGATAADNDSVKRVELWVNNAVAYQDSEAPFSFDWDTTEFTGLQNQVWVKAYDVAGNTKESSKVPVIVDNALPVVVAVTRSTTAEHLAGSVKLTAAVSDNHRVQQVEFYLDGAATPVLIDTASPYTWDWATKPGTADGEHDVTVKVYDEAGHFATETKAYVVDNTLPTVSVTAPATGSSLPAGPIQLSAAATDNTKVSKVEFLVAGKVTATDDSAPYTWTWDTTSGVNSGQYAITVKAYDGAGNGTTSAEVKVTLDTAKPTVAFTEPAANANVRGAVLVKASSSDTRGGSGIDRVELSDGETPVALVQGTTYQFSWDTTQVSDGVHTLTLRSYDKAGNLSTATRTVTVDNAPPAVSISAPTADAYVKESVSVGVALADNVGVSKVEFFLDGQSKNTDTTAPFLWSWNSQSSTNGDHLLTAKAFDAAGNATMSASVTVKVDNVLPTVTLQGLTANSVVKGTVEVGATATDTVGVAKVEFYVGTALAHTVNSAPYAWTWDTATAANLAHAITAKAYDLAGNVKISTPVVVTVDNQAPVISAVSPADGAHVRGTVAITVTAADNRAVSKVEFFRDPSLSPALTRTAKPYTWSLNTAELTEGVHRIRVWAHDAAGNSTEQTVNLTVDRTVPTVSISGPVNGDQFGAETVEVKAEAVDESEVAKVEFYLAVGTGSPSLKQTVTAAPFTWNWSTSGVSSGTYNITAKVYDRAGNTATSAPITVTVDTTKPSASFSAPAANATVKGTVTVKASAADSSGVDRVEFYLDDQLQETDSVSAYEWGWDTTLVANGVHKLTIKAYDIHGNMTAVSRNVTVRN